MEFLLFPPIELPEYVSIPALVKVDHWNPLYVVTLEDKGVDYIQCSVKVEGQVAGEKILFFISPVTPLAPILDGETKVGVSGTLSFHRSLLPMMTNPDAQLEFLLNEAPAEQPPVVETKPATVNHLAETDPIIDLCADLERYAVGGFATFSEFKGRLEKIKFISSNEYANMFEEAADALFKTLKEDHHRKFANLLIREIKERIR